MDFLVGYLLNFYGWTPYLLVLGLLLACGIGVPLPEDVTLFAAGLMSYYGVSQVWLMILVSMVGVLAGDLFIFFLGAQFGRQITRRWLFHKLLPDERLNAVQRKFHERGDKLLFAARFMPGLRAPIYFSAGTLHVPYRRFLFYDGTAALISVPAIIGSVYYFGDELDRVVRVIRGFEYGLYLVILFIILLVAAKWFMTHKKLKQGN